MKNKVLTLALVVLVLILPTIVAVSSFLYAQNNPVTEGSVSKMILTLPDGGVQSFEKGEKGASGTYDSFIDLHSGANSASALPFDVSSYVVYKVKYYSYDKESDYTYYLTSDPSNNYYRDFDGKLYHIASKAAKAFLKTEYSSYVFPDAGQPQLNIGTSVNVLPNEMTWKYIGINGKYTDGHIKTSSSKPVCNVSGGLQLVFSVTPDYVYATIKNKDGEVVFDNSYDLIDPLLFADNTVYDVSLTAKWYQDENKTKYGEASYSFTANVLSPAVFYMSEHETLRYGDFVIVSAKNIVDPENIGFSSVPALDVEPQFFEYGGYYHALIPFSLALEKTNNYEYSYVFTFTYGDVSQDIPVTLTKRAYGKDASQHFTKEEVNEYRNDTTLKEFDNVIGNHLSKTEDKIYWMTDNYIKNPTSRKIRSGFGIDIIISSVGLKYEHEGVNYYVKEGDNAYACLSGKVVYVGSTKLSGLTVVVEHGGGLKSLYAHLTSASVVVGQEIEKGASVGVVGQSGFCTGTTLHFGLYVYDVPVRYYNYRDCGITLNPIVAKAIGLDS